MSVNLHKRYSTSVVELGEAWAFVMGHMELVGPDPTITISPTWRGRPDGDELERRYHVCVEGSVQE